MPNLPSSPSPSSSLIPICYVIALAAEARPLLDRWKFTQLESAPFPLYYCEQQNYFLVVSGMGKVRSAAATSYLASKIIPLRAQATPPTIWINFGTCGHHNYPLGQGLLVHKIIDISNGNNYYPLRLPYSASATIECHATSQREYPRQGGGVDMADGIDGGNNMNGGNGDGGGSIDGDDKLSDPAGIKIDTNIIDMESAGFFPTACLFSPNELVHLYKVVSDNADNLPTKPALMQKRIIPLLMERIPELHIISDKLRAIANKEFDEGHEMAQQIEKWQLDFTAACRWTTTQRIQLQGLLRKWYVVYYTAVSARASAPAKQPNQPKYKTPYEICTQAKDAKQMLQILQNFIQKVNG